MKIRSVFFATAVVAIAAACGNPSSSSEQQTDNTVKENNEALNVVLAGYFDVKDALVKDDAAKAKEAAAALADKTGEYSDELNASLQAISGTDDIEEQRVAFEKLSEDMYAVAKADHGGKTIYKQFCPMAFDDKGAFWLSDNKEILNPYFGASMLRCGSVKEEIK
jgi:hypothetical protein